MRSSSPGFGCWFPFLVHQVPSSLPCPGGSSSCSVCHLHPFQTNCAQREAVYSLFAEIRSFFISKCTQQGRTLPFVIAQLSVGTGQLEMEDVCQASLTQPLWAGCHSGGKKCLSMIWRLNFQN